MFQRVFIKHRLHAPSLHKCSKCLLSKLFLQKLFLIDVDDHVSMLFCAYPADLMHLITGNRYDKLQVSVKFIHIVLFIERLQSYYFINNQIDTKINSSLYNIIKI